MLEMSHRIETYLVLKCLWQGSDFRRVLRQFETSGADLSPKKWHLMLKEASAGPNGPQNSILVASLSSSILNNYFPPKPPCKSLVVARGRNRLWGKFAPHPKLE